LLRGAANVSRDDYEKALAQRQALLPVAASIYDGIDVLLSPACPFVAPVTTPPSDTPQGEAEGMFTAIFNLTGDPAIVLPCGWSSNGLPIGVQLSSTFGSDNALLAAAGFVESVLAVAAHTPAIR
jgi:Asp-tRNA(Asn)/Glu-tRNA(Gln) amidotransferase A subunit family amidase